MRAQLSRITRKLRMTEAEVAEELAEEGLDAIGEETPDEVMRRVQDWVKRHPDRDPYPRQAQLAALRN